MSEFRINRKSWHYKIARFSAQSWDPDPKTFCQYWRNFILSVLLLLFLGSVCLFLLAAIVVAIYLNPAATGVAFVATIGTVVAGFLTIFSVFKVNEVHKRAMTTENPSVFQMKYRAFKQKVCPTVVYED